MDIPALSDTTTAPSASGVPSASKAIPTHFTSGVRMMVVQLSIVHLSTQPQLSLVSLLYTPLHLLFVFGT